MKRSKSVYMALVAALVLAAGSVTARAQAPPQPGDQSKNDASATKKDKQPKKPDAAAQTPPQTPSASTAPATAPAAAAPASTPNSSAPAPKPAAAQQVGPANAGGVVWVNTDSGIYHKPGSRFYGKTKKGKYMTEADAKKAGYREAKKSQ